MRYIDTDSNNKKNNKVIHVVSGLFVFFIVWWILFFVFGLQVNETLWGMTYQLVALFGAVAGIYFAYSNVKNKIDKMTLYAFCAGLLFQCIGQTTFSIYLVYLHVPLPYPSFADVGYFGSILFYICGALLLFSKERKTLLQSSIERFQAFLIFAVLYILSYIFFLQGYHVDLSHPVKLLLDLGYPLGQATYVSLAVVLCISLKQGRLFLLALIIQYFADFNFLFQANHGLWITHGYGDVIYLCAYLFIGLAVISYSIKNKI